MTFAFIRQNLNLLSFFYANKQVVAESRHHQLNLPWMLCFFCILPVIYRGGKALQMPFAKKTFQNHPENLTCTVVKTGEFSIIEKQFRLAGEASAEAADKTDTEETQARQEASGETAGE